MPSTTMRSVVTTTSPTLRALSIIPQPVIAVGHAQRPESHRLPHRPQHRVLPRDTAKVLRSHYPRPMCAAHPSRLYAHRFFQSDTRPLAVLLDEDDAGYPMEANHPVRGSSDRGRPPLAFFARVPGHLDNAGAPASASGWR